MHHATTIGIGYQSVIHCGVLRQAAEIISITPIHECLSSIQSIQAVSAVSSVSAIQGELGGDETTAMGVGNGMGVGDTDIDTYTYMDSDKFVLRTGASKLYRLHI